MGLIDNLMFTDLLMQCNSDKEIGKFSCIHVAFIAFSVPFKDVCRSKVVAISYINALRYFHIVHYN